MNQELKNAGCAFNRHWNFRTIHGFDPEGIE